jgi:methylglutaconyl-CoA hydratase
MLRIEEEGPALRLSIDRPDVRNALGPAVVAEIARGLDRAATAASIRVVVLTGVGKIFSAGADLASMREQGAGDLAENRANALSMGELFHRIYHFPKPVVARVPGPAIGGGVGLMAACDVIIAAESAFFSFSEVRLGIVPALISPFCLRRLGIAATRRFFLTGEKLSASVAEKVGLVDRVVSDDALDEATRSVVDSLLQGAPGALAEAKRLVSDVAAMTPEQALPFTADVLARVRAGSEAREGVTAFLEKRSPAWSPKRR